MGEQLVAFAGNAFDIEQGSVPKTVFQRSETFLRTSPGIRVICLVGYPGECSSDSTPRHQQSSGSYEETWAGGSGLSAVLFLFLTSSVSVLANFPSLWQNN